MKIILLTAIILILGSCSKDPVPTHNLSGYVYHQGRPSGDIPVALREGRVVVRSAQTDADGYFSFADVPESRYTVTAQQTYDNGSFVENSADLVLTGDVQIDTLRLPEPVVLYPVVDFTNKSATLAWSVYPSGNFYEYKIYRHTTSGLDETTGKLVHIATSAADTVFTDTGAEMMGGLAPNTTYYYRVYVNNEYGRLSGSNIRSVTTSNWENEENFTVFYKLELTANFPGMGGQVWGIDYDGSYFWILEVYEQGGYYDTNLVQLIRYDYQNDEILKKFEYRDEYIIPRCLTFAEGFLYVYYDRLGSGTIKKLSPSDGSVVRTYSADPSIQDMDAYGPHLYMNDISNLAEQFKLENLEYISAFSVPFGVGTNSGIACRDSEIWLSARSGDQIVILDNSGNHIGVVKCSVLSDWNGITHLCFMNDRLVLLKDSRIYIFNISG
jgi:hypothetical protein